MDTKTMKVLLVEPRKSPREKEIGGRLEDLQKAVGGYIEAVYPFEDPVALVVNEEGKLKRLPPNRPLYDENGRLADIICGSFLVVGLGEENFIGLSDDLMQKYKEKFKDPHIFVRKSEGFRAIPVPDPKTPPRHGPKL